MREPKILIFDLETSHNLLLAFDLMNKYSPIPYKNILVERHIFTASWKWVGESKVYGASLPQDKKRFAKDIHDDRYVIDRLMDAINQSDMVVAHYGDKFDLPYLNTRLIKHGYPPLPPVIQYDTYKVAKAKFKFNSNRLDYLGHFLGVGGKLHTAPGLWHECFLQGKKSAFKQMLDYNKQDVELLEKVYLKLRAFAPPKLNMNHFTKELVCSHCGSSHVQKRGYRLTQVSKFQRYQCMDCGGWSSERLAEKQKTAGK